MRKILKEWKKQIQQQKKIAWYVTQKTLFSTLKMLSWLCWTPSTYVLRALDSIGLPRKVKVLKLSSSIASNPNEFTSNFFYHKNIAVWNCVMVFIMFGVEMCSRRNIFCWFLDYFVVFSVYMKNTVFCGFSWNKKHYRYSGDHVHIWFYKQIWIYFDWKNLVDKIVNWSWDTQTIQFYIFVHKSIYIPLKFESRQRHSTRHQTNFWRCFFCSKKFP